MAPRRLRAVTCSAIAFAVVCGCHSGNSDAYPTWAKDPAPYSPRANSGNAFDSYVLAAGEAETQGGAFLTRVSFFPGQKKDASKAIADAVKQVVDATGQPCQFEFVPHKPFQPVRFQAGWRLIGRVLVWRVEDACQAADYDSAIASAVAATRFGFGLTGGGATDASLGFALTDEARRAIAPHLTKMSAAQLDHLAAGIKTALDEKPPISAAIRNEHENSMEMIQFLQDSLRAGQLKVVTDNLGPDSNEPIRYLEQLEGNTRKRTIYFDSLAKATDAEFADAEHDADVPEASRGKSTTKLDTSLKKLAKYVYGSARPLLDLNDETVARTRLLILYAQIIRQGKEEKSYPQNLDGFSKDLIIDPYSGVPFVYHADQAEFSLYSVGSNGRDDGGDTDDTFTRPDLRLETPGQ